MKNELVIQEYESHLEEMKQGFTEYYIKLQLGGALHDATVQLVADLFVPLTFTLDVFITGSFMELTTFENIYFNQLF